MALEFSLDELENLITCGLLQIDSVVFSDIFDLSGILCRKFGPRGSKSENLLHAAFRIVAIDLEHGLRPVHRAEYVVGKDRTWHCFQPLDTTDMHYVRGNLLVLIFACDSTERERRLSLERQRNQIALLNLVRESPDLAQSGDDLFFTFARIRLLIERS